MIQELSLIHIFLQTLNSSGGTLSVALYMYVSERGELEVGFAIAAIFCSASSAV